MNEHARPYRRVLACLLRWDYGKPERGQSTDDAFFVPALRELADEVETFWYDEHFDDLDRLQRLLLERVDAFDPELVFFAPFLEHVRTETLDRIRAQRPTLAWFSDDQWRFDSYSSSYGRHFTHVVTTDEWMRQPYQAVGIEPIVSQWAAQYVAPAGPATDEELQHDVSFIGLKTPYRAWFVKRLRKLGVDVACFGHGWPTGRISFDAMNDTFRRSRINLNLSNSVPYDVRAIFSSPMAIAEFLRSRKRVEQIKARHFEIPAAGGFELSYYVPGIEDHYVVGEELAVFTSPEDCARQVQRYLGDPDRRRAIAGRGWERSRREHGWTSRLDQVFAELRSG